MKSKLPFWFSVLGPNRRRWPVLLSSEEFTPEFDRSTDFAVGLTDYDHKHVVIDVQHPLADHDETVLHELMHVALMEAPISCASEEVFISHLSPKLWPMLKQFGLKWPERPDEFWELRKRAKRGK